MDMHVNINDTYNQLGTLLEAGEFQDAIDMCNSLLAKGYKNVNLYLIKLLAEAGKPSLNDLKSLSTQLDTCPSYNLVLSVAPKDVADYLIKCNELSQKNVSNNKKKAFNYLNIPEEINEEDSLSEVNVSTNDGYIQKKDGKNKKINKKIYIIFIALIIAILSLGIIIVSITNNSIDKLCNKGIYDKAYEKAKDDEKARVLEENLAAYLSAKIVKSIGSPDIFNLVDVYYSEPRQEIVLCIDRPNSYGVNETEYWPFAYAETEHQFVNLSPFAAYYTDLKIESSNSEDVSVIVEELAASLAKQGIREALNDGRKLEKKAINNINGLVNSGKINEVELVINRFIVTEK